MTQQTLHFDKKSLSVTPITARDVRRCSPVLRSFRELITTSEEMYPRIHQWLEQKVMPGLLAQTRSAFIGFVGGQPVASAVVKRGERAKFCHLRVANDLQNKNLGELFFTLMAFQVRDVAREVHFTLPESLWEERREFFRGFGFSERVEAGTQYRLFEPEVRCSALFSEVWPAALSKVPKLAEIFTTCGQNLDQSLILSVKPQWADAIISGTKSVEIRRSFSRKWEGRRVALYATRPRRELVGDAQIAQVIVGSPEEIWRSYSGQVGCKWSEFKDYVQQRTQIFALLLVDVRPFAKPVRASEVADLLGKNPRPPQNYEKLRVDSLWSRGVSLAAFFNAGYQGSMGDRLLGEMAS